MILQFTVIIACNLLVITSQARLSIINTSQFPHPPNTKFQLQVVPANRIETIDQLITNTMIIQIKDNNGKENGKVIFDYGRKYKIDGIIDNDFITIEEWTKNQDSTLIQISILFKRISNGHVIQIFDLQPRSLEARESMINNLTLATLLYNKTIELVWPSKLELTVNSTDGDNVVLVLGQLVVAKCRSYDGIPVGTPNFTNLQHFDVVNKSIKKNNNNEMEITFRGRLVDHLKHLNCSAGQTHTSMMIRVLHPTTTIIIDPPVNKTLEVNSTISCYSKDGYPPAQTQWHLIEGPENAASFYTVRNEGKTLHITDNAPTQAIWRFICSVKGGGRMNETISFITTDKYCGNICLNGRLNKMEGTLWKYVDQIKLLTSEILQIKDQVNKSMEIFKEKQNLQNDQIKLQNDQIKLQNSQILQIKDQVNKSMEIFKETSTSEMKLPQDSIANITKKYDSIKQTFQPHMITSEPMVVWTINKISDHMKTIRIVHEQFVPVKYGNVMWLWVNFHPDRLEIYIDSESQLYPLQLNVTIGLVHPSFPQKSKFITKTVVQKFDYDKSPYFIFTKMDVSRASTNDSITIKCYF